jgi:hypothetical protein
MQIPPNIPKPAAPPPQDLKPEPVARVAPVVMNDAAARIDPSVILKTPVPVSSGPRTTHQVRSSTDQSGTIYTAPEIPEDPEAAAHIAKLSLQLGKVESGPHSLKWPMPQEFLRQIAQQPNNQSLAQTPREALAMLRSGLIQSPMLAVANFAEAIGVVKEKSVRGTISSDSSGTNSAGGSSASGNASSSNQSSANAAVHAGMLHLGQAQKPTASSALQNMPAPDSQALQDGLNLLMHGQLVWQGQLTPGVPAKIYREDAYLEDPATPGGGLVKGAQISIELELPTIGQVVVRGLQIAESVSVVIHPEQRGQTVLARNFQALKDHLVTASLEAVKVRLQSRDGAVIE